MTEDAFKHPAKMTFGVAEWIYKHAAEHGWIQAGDIVVDPFGGVGGTAFHAMKRGLLWIGVELESKKNDPPGSPFVEIGQNNIDHWRRRYGNLPGWGNAVLVQGDSRQLADVLKQKVCSLVASSPPYSEIAAGSGGLNHKPSKKSGQQSGRVKGGSQSADQHYGKSSGQLSRMVVGSPPFATGDSASAQSLVNRKDKSARWLKKNTGWTTGYGTSKGQLATMKEGSLAVSSPPYLEGLGHGGGKNSRVAIEKRLPAADNHRGYGGGKGNLVNCNEDTFWSAAAKIMAEVYKILKPGGVAIWVCGDFVRKGKRVPFCDHWQALCERAGFVPVCRHVAWKKQVFGVQQLLDGGEHVIGKSKVSFFRRHQNKLNPEQAIESEEIICMRKP